ncbi:MAG: hypothetical protein KGO94_10175, partial [Alphaproteobacteria bacterium]|nr:hypothetical protein [Alphaproteobacteria bacterium]
MKFNRAFFIAIIAALFGWQSYLRFQSDIIQDAAWFIYVAEQLLNGKTLYADIKEVNPPLGMWMFVPIIALAKVLSANAVHVTYLALLALSAACIGLCHRYLRLLSDLQPMTRYGFTIAATIILLFFPAAFFAEREHFIILMFLPWVFLYGQGGAAHKVQLGERIFVGALAGLAICIKPQAAFAPLLLVAVRFYHMPDFKALFAVENMAAVVISILYAISIVIFAPVFLSEMVTLGSKAYVPYYGYPLEIIALNTRWPVIALLVCVLLRLRMKATKTHTGFFDLLVAVAVGFLMAYVIQMKGFTYQIMPAIMAAALALAAGSAALWQTEKKLSLPIVAAIGVFGLVLNDVPQTYFNPYKKMTEALAKDAPDAKSIFIASTRLDDAFPFVQKRNLQWASRLPTQWLAPYVASHSTDAGDEIVLKARDWAVSDLAEMKPDVVMIDVSTEQAYVPGGTF